jgi:tubulin-specific chaperone B
MAALSLSSLKSYVAGGAPRAVSDKIALLDVEHSLIKQRFVEIPFDVSWSIDEVKHKIYSLCGTQPQHQQLHINSASGALLTQQSPSTTLASYGVRGGVGGSGCSACLYVVDVNPFALGRNGALHDVSQVQKYEMSDEEYGRRENTYRAFKERMKAADPKWRSMYEKKTTTTGDASEESEVELRARCLLDSRCQISPGDRRGRIRCQQGRRCTDSSTQRHTAT